MTHQLVQPKKVIHKYEAHAKPLKIGWPARFLIGERQNGLNVFWIEETIRDEKDKVTIDFKLLNTGDEVPEGYAWVATYMLLAGCYIEHLYAKAL